MKKHIFLLLAFFIVSIGCATNQDLKKVQHNLRGEILDLQKEVKESVESNKPLRKEQADISADMTGLRDEVQKFRGIVEELNRDVQTIRKGNDSGVATRKQLSEISFRIDYIENFLGIGEKNKLLQDGEKKEKESVAPKDTTKENVDKEATYSAAYKTFKEGKYDGARVQFQRFLKLFPDTEYSDNAQFWIGECYFFKKEYEKAILEYEKVIKNYPGGNKVSYSLLKQGQSFLKLGDKSSAKLLLQQVIKDYPNTNQAKIARAKLTNIK